MEWLKEPAPFLRIHDGFRKSTSPRSNILKIVDSFISQIYAQIFFKIKKIKKHLRFSIKCKLIFGLYFVFSFKIQRVFGRTIFFLDHPGLSFGFTI